ncbi:hypothetical protein GS939_26250 [Rhodococcus hoagii]|nr:hypothetical protein [Prescottella equi]
MSSTDPGWSTSTCGRRTATRRSSCGCATAARRFDTIALVAGLFRALVEREAEALDAGRQPGLQVSPTLVRAAMWRAARSGLEGELVDVEAIAPRPAPHVVDGLIGSLRPQLESAGDWDVVSGLAATTLRCGKFVRAAAPDLLRRVD